MEDDEELAQIKTVRLKEQKYIIHYFCYTNAGIRKRRDANKSAKKETDNCPAATSI